MAGDWIKVGHALPDKPEVIQMADRLSIDQDMVAGKLVRFWIWADQQTVDGNAPGATPAFIDRLTNCPGFSAALLEVGWLVDRNGRLQLPNFDRHNGQTAKQRALTSARVKRSRNAPTVTPSVTESLPEKRREDERTSNTSRGPSLELIAATDVFIARWNATPGTRSVPDSSALPLHDVQARLTDPQWLEHYPEALALFPLKCLGGEPMDAWKFLEEETVGKIRCGRYDFPAKGSRRKSGFDFDAALEGSKR